MTRADRDKLRRLVVEGQHLAPSLVLELLDQVDIALTSTGIAAAEIGYLRGVIEGQRERIELLERQREEFAAELRARSAP